MDGSQKLPQRIFVSAIEDMQAGRDAFSFAFVTALWIAYAMRTPDIDDPRREELRAAAAKSVGDDPSAPFFAIPGLFPQALVENSAWRALVNAELRKLNAG